jgi:hypothetical protein
VIVGVLIIGWWLARWIRARIAEDVEIAAQSR